MSNNPPNGADYYINALQDLKDACAEWSQGVVNNGNASSLRDLIGRVKDLAKSAEKDRKAIKEPYLEQGRKIDAEFKPVSAMADSLVAPLNQMLTAFLKAEDERKRREAEEAREKAEAEARAAAALKEDEFVGADAQQRAEDAANAAKEAAKAAEKTNVSGFEQGRAMGLRTHYRARVVDSAAMVAHYANHPDVIAAAEKLAGQEVRAAKGAPVSIPGIEVVKEQKAA